MSDSMSVVPNSLGAYESSVYDKVYTISEEYMLRLLDKPLFGRDVFLLAVGHPQSPVDMSSWTKLDDNDFVFACYILLLGRYPSAEEVDYWRNRHNFRPVLCQSILSSKEFLNRGIQAINCPYCDFSVRFQIKCFLMRAWAVVYRFAVYPITRWIPADFKRKLKQFLFHRS